MQKVALAISLTMLKERTFISYKTRETEKFLDSLLTEGEMSYSDMVKSANYCNIAIDCPYICCIITFVEQFELNETRDWVGIKAIARKKLIEDWASLSEEPAVSWSSTTTSSCYCLRALISSPTSRSQWPVNTAGRSKTMIDPNCSESVYIGIGEPAASLTSVYRSYSQALRVVDLMPKIQEEHIGCYRRYILYELLYDSPFCQAGADREAQTSAGL